MAGEIPTSSGSGIAAVVDRILSLDLAHPVRVAVDGRTASSKTTFADDLACAIRAFGKTVVRASVDGFHHAAKVRHRQGRLSPDGYYEDARDLDAIRQLLLEPLGLNGDRSYVTQTFDLENDRPVDPVAQRAGEDTILIVDGTFLQRPELRSAWDFVVFLDVPEHEARQRAVDRDADTLGGRARALELYARRYGPAFSRYQVECKPAERADVVLENSAGGPDTKKPAG
jgi:uridine kinase